MSNDINKIIAEEINNHIFESVNEHKLDDLINMIKQQRSSNFIHHQDHLDFMQKDTGVFPEFGGFKDGFFHFTHESSEEWEETADMTYDIYIKFFAWPEVVSMAKNGKSSKEITDHLYNGDLGVFCTCHAFWYFYSYAATQKGAHVYLQKIPSPITNPSLEGFACKHLDACLSKQVLRFQYQTIRNAVAKHQSGKAKAAIKKVTGSK